MGDLKFLSKYIRIDIPMPLLVCSVTFENGAGILGPAGKDWTEVLVMCHTERQRTPWQLLGSTKYSCIPNANQRNCS